MDVGNDPIWLDGVIAPVLRPVATGLELVGDGRHRDLGSPIHIVIAHQERQR
ncbi:hypothetical protein SAMCCGM7_pC0323 (plasmid) [Sinorhizobium americanum CCGM7]|uniref:hypothetical protein n=1 Tax=Sinorhizobium americanum TaxID=194963 RepID=UPI0004D644D4|nr:hypothetical protein [Sinorhizobium americanum]APG87526.1 hypothetical protein SAMCCGM7_pC0323 [Sinorhizobium americanum CCGM7]